MIHTQISSVAQAVRFARERANLSARAVSSAAELSPSYVTKVENEDLFPSLTTFSRIAIVVEMTPAEILHCITLAAARPIE